jgi:DNA ligase-associated metallophosphoesterase
MMDRSRCEIIPGVWLDYRRALFLEKENILCVADLHLGYAWAHRFHGQMMPVHTPDRVIDRLLELCAFYKPQVMAFLGDIVHQAVPVSEIEAEFMEMVTRVGEKCGLKLVLGNHDKNLKKLGCAKDVEFCDSWETGRFLFLHGNEPSKKKGHGSLVFMGHEHPAISLGDGVKSGKFPCFLISEEVIVLPAFSHWAAGTNIRCYDFMSPLPQSARFEKAVAILGEKLLPVRLREP